MIISAYDPGTHTHGVIDYDTETRRVVFADPEMDLDECLLRILVAAGKPEPHHIAIERVQASGTAGNDIILTTEHIGRLWQRALDSGLSVSLHRRHSVLSYLDVAGPGNKDAMVRGRLIEIFADGDWRAAKGTLAAPGPCWGVVDDCWAALGVAVTAAAALS